MKPRPYWPLWRTLAIILIAMLLSWAPFIFAGWWLFFREPAAGDAGGFTAQIPPSHYFDNPAAVSFRLMNQSAATSMCHIIKAPEGAIACGREGLAIVPTYSSSGLAFWDWVRVVIHELGHAFGWPADHPKHPPTS